MTYKLLFLTLIILNSCASFDNQFKIQLQGQYKLTQESIEYFYKEQNFPVRAQDSTLFYIPINSHFTINNIYFQYIMLHPNKTHAYYTATYGDKIYYVLMYKDDKDTLYISSAETTEPTLEPSKMFKIAVKNS